MATRARWICARFAIISCFQFIHHLNERRTGVATAHENTPKLQKIQNAKYFLTSCNPRHPRDLLLMCQTDECFVRRTREQQHLAIMVQLRRKYVGFAVLGGSIFHGRLIGQMKGKCLSSHDSPGCTYLLRGINGDALQCCRKFGSNRKDNKFVYFFVGFSRLICVPNGIYMNRLLQIHHQFAYQLIG